jgi:hypothetical protein
MSSTPLKTTVSQVHGEPAAGQHGQALDAEPGRGREFRSFLTVGLLRSRWLRPYATPCHSRGAMV